MNFEEYLMEYFMENEISTDDVDMYESWLEQQDVNDIMELAEKWGKKLKDKVQAEKEQYLRSFTKLLKNSSQPEILACADLIDMMAEQFKKESVNG